MNAKNLQDEGSDILVLLLKATAADTQPIKASIAIENTAHPALGQAVKATVVAVPARSAATGRKRIARRSPEAAPSITAKAKEAISTAIRAIHRTRAHASTQSREQDQSITPSQRIKRSKRRSSSSSSNTRSQATAAAKPRSSSQTIARKSHSPKRRRLSRRTEKPTKIRINKFDFDFFCFSLIFSTSSQDRKNKESQIIICTIAVIKKPVEYLTSLAAIIPCLPLGFLRCTPSRNDEKYHKNKNTQKQIIYPQVF